MVLDFFEFAAANKELFDKDWIISGKGPSYKKGLISTQDKPVLSLNDVVVFEKVTVAHFTDIEAFNRCSDSVVKNADYVLMPYVPHYKNRAHKRLVDLLPDNEALSYMERHNRLLAYNLSTSKHRYNDSFVVPAGFFSAEGALEALALAGVQKIYQIGIDGGRNYSETFQYLNKVSLLVNNQSDFNVQFQGIANIVSKYKLDYQLLEQQEAIKVYVGCSDSEKIPFQVLEYSIRSHTGSNVEVVSLKSAIDNLGADSSPLSGNTPFSLQRFLIPELNGCKGRAIYLDSDMIVKRDIREIWELDFNGCDVLYCDGSSYNRESQSSVMLIDCSAVNWSISDILYRLNNCQISYQDLLSKFIFKNATNGIPAEWNSLEKFDEKTALLHYTHMPTQPWVSIQNPLDYVWIEMLRSAVCNDFISKSTIAKEVEKHHVRPSLFYQIFSSNIDTSILLPSKVKLKDSFFLCPYAKVKPGNVFMLYIKFLYRVMKRVLQMLKYAVKSRVIG